MQGAAGRLVARQVDGLLVGWLAVATWIAAFVTNRLGIPLTSWHLSSIFWVGAAVSAAHFGLSYHLAYGGGVRTAARRHPVALGIAPLLLAAGLAVVVTWSLLADPWAGAQVTRALITTVYLFTTWHYVKQVYGVGRVGAAFAGISLTSWEVRALRYGLYPMWWLGASAVLVRGAHNIIAGYVFGYSLLPDALVRGLRGVALVAAALVAGAVVTACRRAGRRPSSILLASYVAALLWLALPTSPLLLVALLAPFHALQYLAIGHRAEVAMASTARVGRGLVWWLNIFGGAAAGGLLASRWLPQLLDTHLGGSAGPLRFTAAFFVFLNLHHYLIDAVIWRSDQPLVKAVVRGPVALPAPREPAIPLPARRSTPAVAVVAAPPGS